MYYLRSATVIRRAPLAVRPIVTSARLSNSNGSHMANNDPKVLEREKHRSLHAKHDDRTQTQKVHAPGWIEDLASVSEAHIKADRAETVSPEALQKQTTDYIRKRHHEDDPLEAASETVHSAAHTAASAAHTVTATVHKVAEKISEILPGGKEASGTAPYERDQVEGPLAGKGKEKET